MTASSSTLPVRDGNGIPQLLDVYIDAGNSNSLVGKHALVDPSSGSAAALSSAAAQPINSSFTTATTGALLTVKPGMWSVSADGAAGTGATAITTASGTGKFQVIDSISCGVAADATGAAQGVTECQVIHDVAGTPVILWRTGFSFPAGAAAAGSQVTVSGLSIVQPVANKAITINFVGATGNSLAVAAHTVSWVNMSGYVIG